jgi:TonB-linked SusC/RagA family outer membrane protein
MKKNEKECFLGSVVRIRKLLLLTTAIILTLGLMKAEAGNPSKSLPGSNPQGITVTGTITDKTTGELLPGVNIVVDGTTIGTVSDMDGNYSLEVPDKNSVLVFSFIGYVFEKVELKGETKVNISLSQDIKGLEEVVVVGYGTQKKVTMTGSVSNVSGDEVLKSPSASLGNAIAGKLPGVSTVQYSGLPGGDDPLILVRGVATLSAEGAAPLVMVDGVERSFTQIDPNEVADISILKDASATAVFGVRGANGVILVTTERGKAGKTKISASASYGLQAPTTYLDFVNSYEYATTYNEVQRRDGDVNLRFSDEAIQHFKDGDMPLLYPDMNWVDYVMKSTAPQTQQNVNISGGNDNVKYFVSVGMLQQDGLFRTFSTDDNEKFSYNRYNYRANLDIKIDEINSLSVNIGGRVEDKTALPRGEGDIFESILFAPPMSGAGIIDGKRVVANVNYVGQDMRNDSDPMRFYGSGHQQDVINVLNLDLIYNANLDVVTEGLKFRLKGSYNSKHSHKKIWQVYEAYPSYKPYLLEDGTLVFETSGDKWKTEYSEDNNATIARDWYAETGFDYARTFGNHEVSGLVLYNQSKYYYPWPYQEIPRGYVGLVGRATYNYASKYLFDFNIGYNGSENFAPGKRYGTFPAGSIGWIATEEPWMKNQKIFSYLKLRYSYGVVGNDRMGGNRFLYLSPQYSIHDGYYNGYGGGQHGYNFGTNNTTFVPGATEDTSGNPEVTWETSVKQNIGVDLRVFKDKLSFNLDLFKENRKDILINNDAFIAAPSSLIASPINYGKVDNKGFEVSLTWSDYSREFKYSISPTFSFNRNKVVEMAEVRQKYDYLYRTGHRVNQPFAYEFFDFYESGVTEDAYLAKFGEAMPEQLGQANLQNGDCIYVDLNDDGKITSEDVHAIGFPDYPEITGSFNFNFSYKNFDLTMLWNGATNVSRSLSWPYNPQFGRFHDQSLVRWVYENSWTPETAETATLPRITFKNEVNNTPMSSVWMTDASYLRLRNIEIGYTVKRIPFLSSSSSVRFYVNGSNLLTFSAFEGNDPENKGGGYRNTVSYPVLKLYNIGLKVDF